MDNKFDNNSKQKTKNESRKMLRLKDKIELFEEYINDPNTDGKIVQSTEYKGYRIGIFLAQIRSEINRNIQAKSLTPELNNKLKGLGLLDARIEARQDQKVEILAEFCRKYPTIWLLRKDEKLGKYIEYAYGMQRKKVDEELDRAERYYTYLYSRFYRGKLSEEQKENLRKSGVRRSIWI